MILNMMTIEKMTIAEMIMIRTIIEEMSIGAMTDMIHNEMRIDRTTINVIVGIITIEIINPNEIIVINNHTGEVLIKKTENRITFVDKMTIAKEIGNSMITRSRKGSQQFQHDSRERENSDS